MRCMSITAMRGVRGSLLAAGAAGAAGSCAAAAAAVAPRASALRNVSLILRLLAWWSESRAHGELEGRVRLEELGFRVGVDGVDQAEGDVQHRHDEAQLHARGGLQLREVEVLVLQVGLARVEEEQEAQRPGDVDVVLGVEQQELVAPEDVVVPVP